MEDVDNLLHVGGIDGLLCGSDDGEGGLGRAIVDESTAGSEQSTDEEDLEQLLLVLAVIEL